MKPTPVALLLACACLFAACPDRRVADGGMGGGGFAGAGGGSSSSGGGASSTGGGSSSAGGGAGGGGGSVCGGCRDALGDCHPGDQPGACGSGGNSCAVCGANETCGATGCIAATGFPNDTCATAIDFPLDGGVPVDGGMLYQFTVDLSGAADDYSEYCDTSFDQQGNPFHPDTGPDAVWRLHLSSMADITFSVQAHPGSNPSSDSIAMIAKAPCEDQFGFLSVLSLPPLYPRVCSDGPVATDVETVTLARVPSQDLYLVVDNFCSTTGCFMNIPQRVGPQDVSLWVMAPTPPPANDTCATPRPLFTDGGIEATIVDNGLYAADDATSACDTTLGGVYAVPDVIYSFTVTTPSSFRAAIDRPDSGTPLALSLTAADCQAGKVAGAELGCTWSERYGPTPLVADLLPAGQYYLVVEDFQSAEPYQLQASLGPPNGTPVNTACPGAAALPFVAAASGSMRATVTSTTRDAGLDFLESCAVPQGTGTVTAQAAGPDVAFSVAVPPGDAGVTLRAFVRSLDQLHLLPAVFLQPGCGAAGPGVICGQSVPETYAAAFHAIATADGVAPGSSWTVWVGSTDYLDAGVSGGPFELTVDLAGPPPNDTCAGAIAVATNSSVAGNTTGAHDDREFYNPVPTMDGPDLFYTVTPAVNGPITIKLSPEAGTQLSAIVCSDCTQPNVACIAGTSSVFDGVPIEVQIPNAMAQVTYFVAVDSAAQLSASAPRGGFTLEVWQ